MLTGHSDTKSRYFVKRQENLLENYNRTELHQERNLKKLRRLNNKRRKTKK